MGITPQAEGLSWEAAFAKSIGGRLQPGSGNKFWARLDIRQGAAVLWSLKSSPTAQSIRITNEMIHEMVGAAEGPGGIGIMPALAVNFQRIPEPLTIVRTSDFFRVLRGEVQLLDGHTKGDRRRATADVPLLMRD